MRRDDVWRVRPIFWAGLALWGWHVWDGPTHLSGGESLGQLPSAPSSPSRKLGCFPMTREGEPQRCFPMIEEGEPQGCFPMTRMVSPSAQALLRRRLHHTDVPSAKP